MKRDHGICPNCGSGDIEFLLRTHTDEVFADIPTANRHCYVCGILWEVDEIDLETRTG